MIEHDNYETFLLLYIDNELTGQQRLAVEDYVAINPLAKAALEVLQTSILPAESNITFENKHLLYKKASGITLANYEEYFLLYTDNELGHQQKDEVEHFVLTHPPLQTAFEQLLKSRLIPDAMVFSHKDTLYKKHQRKVYPIYWTRLAVAASLIGVAAFLYIVVPAGNTSRQSIAGNTTISTIRPANTPTGKATTTLPQIKTTSAPDNADTQTGKKDLPKQVENVQYAANNQRPAPLQKLRTLPRLTNNTVAIAVSDNSGPQFANNVAQPIAEERLPNTITAAQPTTRPANITLAKTPLAIQPVAEATVHQTVYKVLDTNTGEENNVLLLGSAQINKHKLKGLLRKASSLFDRKTDRTAREKTIRIASFEL